MRSSSRWLALAVFGLMIGLMADAARAAEVTGTWKWTVTRQNGDAYEATLKLKQDGQKVTGKLTGRQGNETEIEEGKIEKEEISFKVTREFNGNKVVMSYKGKLSGDTIKGKIEFERDGEKRERDWDAKRS